jgi:hypothetical protein
MACIALASCRSYPRIDPIYGRQTIPAQRTGAIGSLTSQPPPAPGYYDRPGPGGSPRPPAPGGTNDGLAPPGGFEFKGNSSTPTPPSPSGASTGGDSRWNTPGRTVSSGDDRPSGNSLGTPPLQSTNPDDFYGPPSRYENRSSPGSTTTPSSPLPRSGGFSNDGSASVSTAEPFRTAGYKDGRSSSGQSSSAQSSSAQSSSVQDIMDLPARGAMRSGNYSGSHSAQAARETISRGTGPLASAAGIGSAGESAEGRHFYDYDRDYRWLKGRLEYSNISRRWKLRYIPISGETDRFGGSVILQDAPQLQELSPGDFVMVEGQVARQENSSGFAPMFRADRISRLQ